MKNNNDKTTAGVKEIAKRANVSIATVDRVIHNRPGVSEKTKEKINAIIRELDYQPNLLAKRLALAHKGPMRLAILIPAISEETEFWQAPLTGIDTAEAELKQYNVKIERFFFDQNDQQSFTEQSNLILNDKPDGILFTPTFIEAAVPFINACKDNGIPYVLFNSDMPGHERLCYIGPELFHSGYQAAQLLHYCIQDNEQVLIVNIAKDIDHNHHILRKVEGVRAYFAKHGPTNQLVQMDTTQTDTDSVVQKLSAIMTANKNISAIFVSNSRVPQVARFLEKEGLQDKVTLLGYDYLNENLNYLKKGTIDFLICEKPQEQGYRGIMTLFQHLVKTGTIEETYLMPIDIITKENYQFYRN
ncbi:MAG: substrate-binding domain-containing protein [Chitinophagaceae bacterium]